MESGRFKSSLPNLQQIDPPFTQHVRVNVTRKDLATFKANMERLAYARERMAPLCAAINRVLRPGFAGTFDGMSLGIIRTPKCDGSILVTSDIYTEYTPTNIDLFPRLMEKKHGTESAFYRTPPFPAREQHRNAVARRKYVKAGRFTVSLPVECLKRTTEEGIQDGMIRRERAISSSPLPASAVYDGQ